MNDDRSWEEVKAEVERIDAVAQLLLRGDPRGRMLIDSCVGFVRQRRGPVNQDHPRDADRDALDLATEVAALLLARIYTGDGELRALRAHIKHLEGRVFGLAALSSSPPFIVTQPAKD